MMTRFPLLAIALIAMLIIPACGRQKLSKIDQAKQLLFKGQHAKALELCDKVLLETPTHSEARLLRGQVNQARGDFKSARSDYSLAIEADPRNPDGYYFRYKLSLKLAEADSSGEPESTDWVVEASRDYQKYLLFNRDAAVAGLHPSALPDPLPASEEITTPPLAQLASDDPPPQANAEGNADVADAIVVHDAADRLGPEEVDVDTGDGTSEAGVEDNNEWLAKNRAESIRRIQELDLEAQESLPELTLPPHLDLNQTELPPTPPPPIVRFDLPPVRRELPTSHVKKPRPHTTGIVQGPVAETSPQGRRGRLLSAPGQSLAMNHPFATGPTVHTTGISSFSRPVTSRKGVPLSRGHWSPWFHPAPTAEEQAARSPSKEDDAEEADKSTAPKQVISMALPNTAPTGPSRGTSLGLLPTQWFIPPIPTTGSTTIQAIE